MRTKASIIADLKLANESLIGYDRMVAVETYTSELENFNQRVRELAKESATAIGVNPDLLLYKEFIAMRVLAGDFSPIIKNAFKELFPVPEDANTYMGELIRKKAKETLWRGIREDIEYKHGKT